jgi:hypothetical protein
MSAKELMEILTEDCAPFKDGAGAAVPVTVLFWPEKIGLHCKWGAKHKHVPLHVPPALLESPEVMRKVLAAGRKVLAQEMGLEA